MINRRPLLSGFAGLCALVIGAASGMAADDMAAPKPPAGAMLVPDSGVVPGAAGVHQGPGGAAEPAATATAAKPGDAGDAGGGGILMHGGSSGVPADEAARSDYPTAARADYVFACMQVNGQSRETLERCACSLDVIASLMPFSEYEEAETVMSIRQRGGKSVGIFEYGPIREKVKVLKRAQVEGELRCF